MRRLNATIKVDFISEKGFDLNDKTYFAYVPLENMICYAVAESCDNYSNENSAEIAVKAVLGAFERKPSLKNLKKYLRAAHYALREKRLEASITVVVSDYTRIRYASCGNVKFYLLNNSMIELESETHNYVYRNQDLVKYPLSNDPVHEPRNLSQYLGQRKKVKCFVSKKIELPEGCTMFFATVNIWEALDDVEILDAYENSENFIDSIQALYMSTENEAYVIGSYTLASLFVEKPFKEDNIKKKKRRRTIIIAIVITIILVIIFSIIYYFDRRAVAMIRDLDNKGVEHLDYGRYDMVFEKYDEANARTNALRLRWLHRQEKYVLSMTIPQMKELFFNIIKGDEEFEKGNYENAHSFYNKAQELSFRLSKDADLNLRFAPKMFDMLDQVETYIKSRIERNEKYVVVIKFIKEISDMIASGDKYLDAIIKYKEAVRALSNIDNLEHRDMLMDRIDIEKSRIVAWVESKGFGAVEKVANGDFNGAITIYEEMKQNYLDLGEISRASGLQDKIDDVNAERKAVEDGLTAEIAEAYIQNGDDFFEVNDFESAIRQYNLAKNLYTRLRMSEEIKLASERISEAEAKKAEMELMGSVLAAQILENEGDILLSSGNYAEARNKYRQAQAAYQALNQLDKVVALQDKISSANDIEIAEQVTIAENERRLLVTEGKFLEQEGDNFVSAGDFKSAIECYNIAWEFYLSAGEIDSALAVLVKLRETERKEEERVLQIEEEKKRLEEEIEEEKKRLEEERQLQIEEEEKLLKEQEEEAKNLQAEKELMDNILVAQALENQGDLLFSSRDYDGAKDKYRQAQSIYQALGQLDKVMALQDKISNVNNIEIAEQTIAAENENKLLIAEGKYFEQEGDNFEQRGDFKNAIERYNRARDFYLRAGDIDSALTVLVKLREAERKEEESQIKENEEEKTQTEIKEPEEDEQNEEDRRDEEDRQDEEDEQDGQDEEDEERQAED